jgi:hypothetical protein
LSARRRVIAPFSLRPSFREEAALSKGGLLHRYLSVSCSRSLGKSHHKLQHVTIGSATRIRAAAIQYMPVRAVTPMEAVILKLAAVSP